MTIGCTGTMFVTGTGGLATGSRRGCAVGVGCATDADASANAAAMPMTGEAWMILM